MINASARSPSTPVSRRRYAVVLGLLALAVGATACTMELVPSTAAIADEPEPTRQVDARSPSDLTHQTAALLPSPVSQPDTDLRPAAQAIVDLGECGQTPPGAETDSFGI